MSLIYFLLLQELDTLHFSVNIHHMYNCFAKLIPRKTIATNLVCLSRKKKTNKQTRDGLLSYKVLAPLLDFL